METSLLSRLQSSKSPTPAITPSIFADASVELRSEYTNANATVGYKIQF